MELITVIALPNIKDIRIKPIITFLQKNMKLGFPSYNTSSLANISSSSNIII